MTADATTTTNLSLEKVSKSYPTADGELTVLRDVDLSLRGGEAIAITGPSGSGKSTLLHILGALDRPSGGTVRVDGVDPFALNDRELSRFRNETIGFVFQDHHLLPQCTVLENVLIPTLPTAGVTTDAETRATELIERVGLSPRVTHRPRELSGGERQRVAIARALINRPSLLLCDEPTGNLDRRSADSVADMLLELYRQENAILIVVTHSGELSARLPVRHELRDGALTNAE